VRWRWGGVSLVDHLAEVADVGLESCVLGFEAALDPFPDLLFSVLFHGLDAADLLLKVGKRVFYVC
jgi:hypothetical protein